MGPTAFQASAFQNNAFQIAIFVIQAIAFLNDDMMVASGRRDAMEVPSGDGDTIELMEVPGGKGDTIQ